MRKSAKSAKSAKWVLGSVLSAASLLAFTPSAQAETFDQSKAEWQFAWDVYQFESILPFDLRSQVTVDLPIDIQAPIEHVYSVYSNLQNDVGRHPFLQGFITYADYTDDGVEFINFTALENVPAGPIVIPNKTQAQQRKHPAQYLYYTDSWDLPNVTTHQEVTFQDMGNGTTRVNEHITFLANALLINFTVTNGVSSHQAYQAALKRDIENGTL
jgi:hypothetical protein